MTTQPEALRLADRLECGEISYSGMCKAAAELRRLHLEVQQLKSDLREEVLISNAMLETKDELLAALQNLENDDSSIPPHAWAIVQAAIAKAEGETK
jgi:hypothetical protein